MRLREAIYLLALTIMLSVSFARLACSQTNSLESQSGSDCGGGPPTEVSVEMRIPPERMTAQMTLTFTRKGEALHPILAVVAFDIAVEHRDVGGLVQDLRRGGSSSLAAVVVDSERGAREVWFGKMIESGQQSAQITVELPGLIKQTKVDNYKLAFQPVEGNLKSIAGKSRAISQAKLADVRIELPEGWDVDGNNWDSDRISATELKYKGIITNNTKIEVSFKRTYLTVGDLVKQNIYDFYKYIQGSMLFIVAVSKALIVKNWRMGRVNKLISVVFIIPFFILLAVYLFNDYTKSGSDGWFERNLWIISPYAAFFVAFTIVFFFSLPFVDNVLGGFFKPTETAPNAPEQA